MSEIFSGIAEEQSVLSSRIGDKTILIYLLWLFD